VFVHLLQTPLKLKQLELLFKQHHAALHWFCFQYLKSTEDADEVVNDIFMAIWEKRDELELSDKLKPLLYTIARNKSINMLKKKRMEYVDIDEQFDFVSDHSGPADILHARETERIVQKLIEELPPRCKQIFILSRREFMSNRQIAEIMELNEKTIENQITIAIRFIRAGLNKKNGNGTSKLVLFPWLLAALLYN
jgi:RNA polymerase sigma-70 factor (ECF subfamily)